jgi:hypothetical protein
MPIERKLHFLYNPTTNFFYQRSVRLKYLVQQWFSTTEARPQGGIGIQGGRESIEFVIFSPSVRTELRYYSRTLEIAEFCSAIARDIHSEIYPIRSCSVELSCGKHAASVTLEANSDVKLDHISLNMFRYFLK